MFLDRYIRNFKTITPEQQERLKKAQVFIAGCGGLGCYVVEMLARLGIGHLTIADFQTFEQTNLNRQIFSTIKNLGCPKVLEAKERIKIVNPEVKVTTVFELLEEKNIKDFIREHEVVVDALDNFDTRLLLEKACEELNLPLVHGAVAGWYGQVTTVFPGDRTLSFIYKLKKIGIEKELGVPAFIPAVVAGIQVAETVKILLNKKPLLQKTILYIDLLNNEFQKIDLPY